MSDAKCGGWVTGIGWTGNYCRKDLKTDEQIKVKLCGHHLAGYRRRKANDEARNKERVLSREFHVKAKAVVTRLEKFGVKAYPHYGAQIGRHTGQVVIENPEALADLLEESS